MTTTPTKQDMERAKEHAAMVHTHFMSASDRNLARCYLHALRRIEALEKLEQAALHAKAMMDSRGHCNINEIFDALDNEGKDEGGVG